MELANSIVTLQPGMYILRHPKGELPPLSVSRAAGAETSNGTIQALYTPKTNGAILRDGSDCIVVHISNGPVDLLVTAYLPHKGAVVPAIKIDQVALDPEGGAIKPITVAPKGMSLIGHVERTGDLVASEGERLGDPGSNLRLEGFQVMWPDRPDKVDLTYGVSVEGLGATPPVNSGSFCGTRNQGRRIVGATFGLAGEEADRYRLEGTAYFSGGYEMDVGAGVPLSGPSGVEHLTALKIRVAPNGATGAHAGAALGTKPSRTHVFRASLQGAGKRKKK